MKIIDKVNIKDSRIVELEIFEKLPPHPNIVRFFFHRIENQFIQIFMKKY